MKIGAIIQARMTSTRLPGKVMIEVGGKTMLSHVIERVKQSRMIDEIIIATTTNKEDAVICDEAQKCGVQWYRGSEDDVLDRYFRTAITFGITDIVRITSDCPLIDPHIVDKVIHYYLGHTYDIVSNTGAGTEFRTYPRGLDCSIACFGQYKRAWMKARGYQREHVTPYIFENTKAVKVIQNDTDLSHHRWTLDTTEDLMFINKVYEYLYHGQHDFYLKEILETVERHGLSSINSHVKQKSVHDPNF